MPLCMWSPLIEDNNNNLALLHCSLVGCLAVYSNNLRTDLNTSCITINHSMWRHGRDKTEEVWWIYGGFWSKPLVKVEIKTTWEVVSTCEVHWIWIWIWMNMNILDWIWVKWCCDGESTRRSFQAVRSYEEDCGASSANVVVAHRDPSQRRWTATVRHLICVMSGVGDWTADIVIL